MTSTENGNGQNAIEHSWPMIVVLDYSYFVLNPPSCTGSILNNYFILTAAHCVKDIFPFFIQIKAGIHSPVDVNAITRRVESIYLHPNYTGHIDGYANNIALLELDEPLNFNINLNIATTCIPSINTSINVAQYPKSGTRLAVIGWKSAKQGIMNIFTTLQQGEIFVIDNNDPMCLRSWINPEKQFCAGLSKDGGDPCYGDSGGPILQWIGNRWEQVGITSFSRCGIPGYPSLYTRLAFYTNWIDSILKSHNESLYATTPNPPVTYSCDREKVPCGCGYRPVRLPSARIIGGEDAIPHSWSMVVSIRGKPAFSNVYNHFCGGTILNEWYILTAAHCVDREVFSVYSNITISIGLHDQTELNNTIRRYDRIIIHPLWDRTLAKYDIALLHLSEALDFQTNPLISRTCLPRPMSSTEDLINYPPNNTILTAIGWGRTDNSTPANILQQVNLYSIHPNDSRCADVLVDPKLQLCAGVYSSRKGVCHGDSGGPILQWIGDRWEQVGISSYVKYGCAIRNNPSAFTRLAAFHDWIQWNINPNNYTTSTSTTTTVTRRETSSTPTINNTTTRTVVFYECDRKKVSCGCGLFDITFNSPRIVGGTDAQRSHWTMIVSIRLDNINEHLCAGTILSNRYILTAAHCVENQPLWKLIIVTRQSFLSEEANYIYQVDRIHQHPNYINRGEYFQNDIALLHLTKSIPIDKYSYLDRTCVPRIISPTKISQYPPSKTQLAIIGWGMKNKNHSNMSDDLQQAQVFSIDNKEPMYSNLSIDSDKQFCTEGKRNGIEIDTCLGDSGGPLFQWMEGYWDQVGIISSTGCGIDGQVSVHTRLAYYYDWMASILDYDNEKISSETKINSTDTSIIYHCNKNNVTCGCGFSDVEITPSRIMTGENAVEASWTMFVSLRILNGTKHICGGTLLSNSFVLTAAHCVNSFSSIEPLDLTVVAGITNQADSAGYVRTIRRIYMHPNFTDHNNRFVNNIALLELDYRLLINSNPELSKTCVHRRNSSMLNNEYLINGTQLIVIGWGINNVELEILQQREAYAIDQDHPICSNLINDVDQQFCIRIYQNQTGSCQGDSGTAMFRWTGHYWDQIGIISTNFACNNGSLPDIYTSLSYYRSWMNEILSKTGEYVEPGDPIIPMNNNTSTIRPITTSIIRPITTSTIRPITTSTIRPITTSTSFALKHQLNISLFNIIIFIFLFHC